MARHAAHSIEHSGSRVLGVAPPPAIAAIVSMVRTISSRAAVLGSVAAAGAATASTIAAIADSHRRITTPVSTRPMSLAKLREPMFKVQD